MTFTPVLVLPKPRHGPEGGPDKGIRPRAVHNQVLTMPSAQARTSSRAQASPLCLSAAKLKNNVGKASASKDISLAHTPSQPSQRCPTNPTQTHPAHRTRHQPTLGRVGLAYTHTGHAGPTLPARTQKTNPEGCEEGCADLGMGPVLNVVSVDCLAAERPQDVAITTKNAKSTNPAPNQ